VVMEQGKNQQQPALAAPAVVGEMKAPMVAPPPQRTAARVMPAPAPRPWPVVFTPTSASALLEFNCVFCILLYLQFSSVCLFDVLSLADIF
jgi:hypothetical protein